jgi:hypothetical protein
MQDDKSRPDHGRIEGEGSYTGTRDYNRRTEKFIKEGKVDKAAKEAERALESPEGAELARAEEKGKAGNIGKAKKK